MIAGLSATAKKIPRAAKTIALCVILVQERGRLFCDPMPRESGAFWGVKKLPRMARELFVTFLSGGRSRRAAAHIFNGSRHFIHIFLRQRFRQPHDGEKLEQRSFFRPGILDDVGRYLP